MSELEYLRLTEAALAKALKSAHEREDRAKSQVERLTTDRQACGDLVATCNRDGGHLISEVGWEQAARLALQHVDDLHNLVALRIPDPDDLRVVLRAAQAQRALLAITTPDAGDKLQIAMNGLRATLPKEATDDG